MSTHVYKLLLETKPTMFGNGYAKEWKECWQMMMYQIPIMWKNKEEWFFYHRAMRQTACATDSQIQDEFKSFEKQGLLPTDNSEINELGVYAVVPHPKKKKMGLRAEFEFHRFLGEEDKEGDCKGAGLCPILWGLGVWADGLTYVKVKITEVEIPKDQVKVAFDLVNGKFSKA